MKCLSIVDLENLTKWGQGQKSVSDPLIKRNLDKVKDLTKWKKVKPDLLLVMLVQEVFADILLREMHRDHWVKTVIERESEDFFPDPVGVHYLLAVLRFW